MKEKEEIENLIRKIVKEEIENLIRKIVKEELYHHCLMWHMGIIDEE